MKEFFKKIPHHILSKALEGNLTQIVLEKFEKNSNKCILKIQRRSFIFKPDQKDQRSHVKFIAFKINKYSVNNWTTKTSIEDTIIICTYRKFDLFISSLKIS